MTRHLALGLDFGTESGRALLVDVRTGAEVASAVTLYPHGVIDERLPDSGVVLGSDWALQDPEDWRHVLYTAVPEAMRAADAAADEVIGIGVAFTASTVMPTLDDGAPLCTLDGWRTNPHAWPKLWKHHAAYAQAERITAVARERGERWLERYGGRVSSEWMHSKALQVIDEAPEVFAAIDRWIEGGDWLVWQLAGNETRNATAAGYKGLWQKDSGYPSSDFLRALDPAMVRLHAELTPGPVLPPGAHAGVLQAEVAARMGLRPGTPVSVATIDAHASVPGAGVTNAGRMVLILGTSTCHMLMSPALEPVPGVGGIVEDGIVPGLVGYEAGQAGVGDLFSWYVEHGVPAYIERAAAERGVDVYRYLADEAGRLAPGESGLLVLDWWNGNRSVLNDAALSGMIIGLTLGTRPHEIFRALIEATAFGTRMIVETLEQHGVEVRELVACGGLAERNPLLLQIYADVTGRPIEVGGSGLSSALGAAMFGAVAAGESGGGFDSIDSAVRAMTESARRTTVAPSPAAVGVYDGLFQEYRELHDYFGRGGSAVMKRLRMER